MLRYVFKRILIFIPTLLLISWVAFGLSRLTPGDRVENCFTMEEVYNFSSYQSAERTYEQNARKLGLHRPAFYFSITSQAYPDTLYKVLRQSRRQTLTHLIEQYGNWPQIEAYYQQVQATERAFLQIKNSSDKDQQINFKKAIGQLGVTHEHQRSSRFLAEMQAAIQADSLLQVQLKLPVQDLQKKYEKMRDEATPMQLYIPNFNWYGFDNQYHNWLTSFIRGDFGISCLDQQPVGKRIREAVWWTLILSICSTLIAYLISIPLGVYSAVKKGSFFDRIVSIGLFMLYSLPAFWVATLLIVFFTNGKYGMHIFPTPGIGSLSDSAPFWARFWDTTVHLILPILCLVYPLFAFVTRQMRGGMAEALQQDYIRTARAKGLPERRVIWKHGFRNSLFPVITLLASVFPRAVAGSVIIEQIFGIPGMGRLALESILTEDWSVVFTVLMLGAILTLIGILVADILYAWADPRVKLD